MYFKNVKITRWQQFEGIDIELHERLTILTGANGSGKTTILNIFARHSGWNSISLSTPKEEKESGMIRFISRIFNGKDISKDTSIGQLTYTTGQKCNLLVPVNNSAQYQIEMKNQLSVKCLFIPSHRPIFRYQPLANIPTSKKNKQSAFNEFSNIIKQRYVGGHVSQSVSFVLKNTLIGWAINGYGVSSNGKTIMPKDSEQIDNFEGFQEVLKKILPKTLGFECIEIRNMEIVFVCNDGRDEFLLETASGGISALIDIAWQIFMYSSRENNKFTVLIDEAENHLHPTMQRTLLEDLLSAFPSARFIVSTHSPLIVGSVKDSSIYALTYNEKNKIESRKLDLVKKPKSATEILNDVLGVSFSMPVWVENELKTIISNYSSKNEDEMNFNHLRKDLTDAGLGRFVPYAISEILGDNND